MIVVVRVIVKVEPYGLGNNCSRSLFEAVKTPSPVTISSFKLQGESNYGYGLLVYRAYDFLFFHCPVIRATVAE